MQLSLRSQMIAGVAAVGATAMALTPVAQPDLLPSMQRTASAVDLASFASPIAVLLQTADQLSVNIFNQGSLPDPADLYWPDSFYTPDFSFVFAPGYNGVIPDFANQVSFGGLSAVATNLSGYIDAALYGLNSLVSGPTTAIWNTPFALVTAAGYLLAGQPELALAELQTQILGPLTQTVSDVLQAVGYVLDNVIANTSTLISNTIPALVSNLITTVVNGGSYMLASLTETGTAVFTNLTSLDIEGAWNAAVNGLLGPNGTLGQLNSLSLGIGIVQPVTYDEGVVDTVVIPSLRSDVTSASQRLGDLSSYGDGGIRNAAFVPAPTVTPPAAALAAPAVDAAGAVAGSAAVSAADARSAPAAAESAVTDGAAPTGATAQSTEASVQAGSAETQSPAKRTATRTSVRTAGAGN